MKIRVVCPDYFLRFSFILNFIVNNEIRDCCARSPSVKKETKLNFSDSPNSLLAVCGHNFGTGVSEIECNEDTIPLIYNNILNTPGWGVEILKEQV